MTPADGTPQTVAYPSCGKPVPWVPESTWQPFCSERCRLIDLGEWFDEGHRIPESTEDSYTLPAPKDDHRSY